MVKDEEIQKKDIENNNLKNELEKIKIEFSKSQVDLRKFRSALENKNLSSESSGATPLPQPNQNIPGQENLKLRKIKRALKQHRDTKLDLILKLFNKLKKN